MNGCHHCLTLSCMYCILQSRTNIAFDLVGLILPSNLLLIVLSFRFVHLFFLFYFQTDWLMWRMLQQMRMAMHSLKASLDTETYCSEIKSLFHFVCLKHIGRKNKSLFHFVCLQFPLPHLIFSLNRTEWVTSHLSLC